MGKAEKKRGSGMAILLATVTQISGRVSVQYVGYAGTDLILAIKIYLTGKQTYNMVTGWISSSRAGLESGRVGPATWIQHQTPQSAN